MEGRINNRPRERALSTYNMYIHTHPRAALAFAKTAPRANILYEYEHGMHNWNGNTPNIVHKTTSNDKMELTLYAQKHARMTKKIKQVRKNKQTSINAHLQYK